MVSQQAQQLFSQFQVYQQQAETLAAQKETLRLQSLEIKNALEELEKTSHKEVYKISGPLLVKRSIGDVKKDLNEKQESIKLRLKSVEKTEKMIKEKLEDLRQKLMASEKEHVGG